MLQATEKVQQLLLQDPSCFTHNTTAAMCLHRAWPGGDSSLTIWATRSQHALPGSDLACIGLRTAADCHVLSHLSLVIPSDLGSFLGPFTLDLSLTLAACSRPM